jgi:hypothetical protein
MLIAMHRENQLAPPYPGIPPLLLPYYQTCSEHGVEQALIVSG